MVVPTELPITVPEDESAPQMDFLYLVPNQNVNVRVPLSLEEQMLLDAYRHLPALPRLAARRYIRGGDIRLARMVYHRVLLSYRSTFCQLDHQALDEIGEFATSVEQYQLPFILR